MAKLVEQVREVIRIKHYSIRTEQAYLGWIKKYILFNNRRHPSEMGPKEVSAFLSHLAIDRQVAACTQNQALSALLFLYRDVLKRPLGWLDDVARAKSSVHLPVVLTRQEVQSVLAFMEGSAWLMASLLYGAGLRLMECVRLRVKDVDFGYNQILVRDGKGNKDRVTVLPHSLEEPLRKHLILCQFCRQIWLLRTLCPGGSLVMRQLRITGRADPCITLDSLASPLTGNRLIPPSRPGTRSFPRAGCWRGWRQIPVVCRRD
ncbi:MAG: phage integrase N-terminal SAM-like domain-containing protein [Acidobacteria bacterium]|nr:phage integrase N-terminal SAM-like domain-containing protein [Acidobacteriota bacterium]